MSMLLRMIFSSSRVLVRHRRKQLYTEETLRPHNV
jgi:hypothetical protein